MRQAGFAYYGLLFSVLAAALTASTGAHLLGNAQRREKEAELLACGDEIRRAIESYHAKNQAGINPFPTQLEWLVRDPHQLTVKRYLRRICRDPMQERGPGAVAGPTAWGLLLDANRQIIGVYSESMREPLKSSGFEPIYEAFRQAKHYADWRFIATGGVPAQANGRNLLGSANFIPLPLLPAPLGVAAPAPAAATVPPAPAAAIPATAPATIPASVSASVPEPSAPAAQAAPEEAAPAPARPEPQAAPAPAAPAAAPEPAAEAPSGGVQPFVIRSPAGL